MITVGLIAVGLNVLWYVAELELTGLLYETTFRVGKSRLKGFPKLLRTSTRFRGCSLTVVPYNRIDSKINSLFSLQFF